MALTIRLTPSFGVISRIIAPISGAGNFGVASNVASTNQGALSPSSSSIRAFTFKTSALSFSTSSAVRALSFPTSSPTSSFLKVLPFSSSTMLNHALPFSPSSSSSSSSLYQSTTTSSSSLLNAVSSSSHLSHASSFSFSTTSSSSRLNSEILFDKKSSTFGKVKQLPTTTTTRKTTPGDPTGRRKKDKVPDEYELIASCESSFHVLIPLINHFASIAALGLVFKISTDLVPALLYRGKYTTISDVIFSTDTNQLLAVSIFMATIFVGGLRYVLNGFMLRMYINRETEEYCVVNQGLFGVNRHFFTFNDVRLKSQTLVFQPNYILKGRGYYLDISEFKNLRDYNQMIRLAKKLQ